MNLNKRIMIEDFMISKLNLKGNNLLVFALIYNYQKEKKEPYFASQNDIAKRINSTDRGVRENLNYLIKQNLIEKEILTFDNDAKLCQYTINENILNGGTNERD